MTDQELQDAAMAKLQSLLTGSFTPDKWWEKATPEQLKEAAAVADKLGDETLLLINARIGADKKTGNTLVTENLPLFIGLQFFTAGLMMEATDRALYGTGIHATWEQIAAHVVEMGKLYQKAVIETKALETKEVSKSDPQ